MDGSSNGMDCRSKRPRTGPQPDVMPVPCVRWKSRRMRGSRNAVKVNGVIHVGTPKTHATRSVPFPAFLSEPLARMCEGKGRDSILFGEGEAHMVLPHSQRGWFTAAVGRAQAADPGFPRLTPHDLRHTAASLAISAGANVKAVQRMLGHASAAMTLDVYAELFDDDLEAVSTALDQARSAAVVAKTLPRADPPTASMP